MTYKTLHTGILRAISQRFQSRKYNFANHKHVGCIRYRTKSDQLQEDNVTMNDSILIFDVGFDKMFKSNRVRFFLKLINCK